MGFIQSFVKICKLVKAAMGHTHMQAKLSHLASFFSLWERKYRATIKEIDTFNVVLKRNY
jgi:hypothetical protein